VILVDDEDEPLAGVDVQFEIGGKTETVITDSDGRALL
jgi:hypothetical protein